MADLISICFVFIGKDLSGGAFFDFLVNKYRIISGGMQ